MTLKKKQKSGSSNLLDRPEGGEAVFLVHINFPNQIDTEDLVEFRELVRSTGASIVGEITGSRTRPDPKYFVGTGKAEEIKQQVQQLGAEVVLVNHDLGPTQERNLERLLECRVLDRTGLILDIFAQRARTFEGKLQVELAQLQHLSTRLVRGWTHLERQKGGLGLRGPGETQLETDRRLLGARIKMLHKRLEKVRRTRAQGRRSRQKKPVPTVTLVGYTNAGKSTLFNTITGSNIYAADQLFATLDPTLRRIKLPKIGTVIFSDTVGFIRHLPHDLVEAFRATLEETQQADLICHVVDASDANRRETIAAVDEVLDQIGATDVPQILVFNKCDLLDSPQYRLERDDNGHVRRVWLSALTGEGVDQLLTSINELLGQDMLSSDVYLKPEQAKLRAQLYELGAVRSETLDEAGGWHLSIRLSKRDYQRLFH